MASTEGAALRVDEDRARDVFPLPLEPFELHMITDDRPAYPMIFIVELRFAGRVDRTAMEAAFSTALQRNPMLAARIADGPAGRLEWIPASEFPTADFAEAEQPIDGGCTRPFDLRAEPGLRMWVRAGDERSRILLQFHHACCDGVGAFAFVEDLLVTYAAEYDGSGPPLRPLDLKRLARRGNFDIPPRSFRERTYDFWFGMRLARRFFWERPQPLATTDATRAAQPYDANHPGFIDRSLPESTYDRLRRAATAQNVSLNDILLRDLFIVLRDWNREHGHERNRARLRLNMPASLRSRDDRKMPACNVMSFAFLTRPTTDCDEPNALLHGIRAETQAILRYRLSLYFIGLLAMGDRLKVLSRALSGEHCFATAVLTNMGDPSRRFVAKLPRENGYARAGNLTLLEICGVPPLRPLTRMGITTTHYAGRLTVSARCDPRCFSLDDTHRLVEKYLAQLEQSASQQAETVAQA